MRTVVLVPRRADPERDLIWDWVRRFWALQVGLPIFEGWHDEEEGPFNRSAAINRAAVEAGDWDVAVVIDGDVVLHPRMVEGAVGRAERTGGMVMAYTERHQLGGQATPHVLGTDPATVDLRRAANAWRRYVRGRLRSSCSSANAVTRGLWEEVGGFDEGFVGWGYEDIAFRVACETLSGVEMAKIPGVLFHIWHTVSAGNQPTSPTMLANKERCDRYLAARWDAEAMRAILAGRADVAA
jgi:N-terminal domain of galactosyltransferase